MKLENIQPVCAFMYKDFRCINTLENKRKRYCKPHDKLIKKLRSEYNKNKAYNKVIKLREELERREAERKKAHKEAVRNTKKAITDLRNTHLDLYVMSQLQTVDIFYQHQIIMALKYMNPEEAYDILIKGQKDI